MILIELINSCMSDDIIKKSIQIVERSERPQMSVFKPRYSVPYGLSPITSSSTLDNHYNKLYKDANPTSHHHV